MEFYVVSAMLRYRYELVEKIYNLIHKRDFLHDIPAEIFGTIVDRYEKGLIINQINIRYDYMSNKDNTDTYRNLFENLFSLRTNIEDSIEYARQIRIDSSRRTLKQLSNSISQIADEMVGDSTLFKSIIQIERSAQELVEQRGLSDQIRAISSLLGNNTRRKTLFDVEVEDFVYKEQSREKSVVKTHLHGLDDFLGGFGFGDTIVISARPSMGKTAFVTTIAENICRNQVELMLSDKITAPEEVVNVYIFSLEMVANQIINRFLASHSRVASNDINNGNLSEDELADLTESKEFLGRYPLFIDDSTRVSLSRINSCIRMVGSRPGKSVVFIDRIEQILTDTYEFPDREYFDYMLNEMIQTARRFGVLLIFTSQTIRSAEENFDKRPQLVDLFGDGVLENHADIVLFLFREEFYHNRFVPSDTSEEYLRWKTRAEKVHGLAEIIVAKNRFGPKGTVEVSFEELLPRFSNY